MQPAVLPVWARGGFSEKEPRIRFVPARGGRILGVLFGYPLTAPPAADHNNKILWVAREIPPMSVPLRIEARLDGDPTPVLREVPGGPGPSIIDLPRPGCWRLTLHWANLTDTIDLRYRPRP